MAQNVGSLLLQNYKTDGFGKMSQSKAFNKLSDGPTFRRGACVRALVLVVPPQLIPTEWW